MLVSPASLRQNSMIKFFYFFGLASAISGDAFDQPTPFSVKDICPLRATVKTLLYFHEFIHTNINAMPMQFTPTFALSSSARMEMSSCFQ
jgi:hypothetical protein